MGMSYSMSEAKLKAFRLLVSKPEENKLLGRPRSRWADNIKIYFRDTGMGWYGLD
jgi:hypothetical protein